MAKSQPGILKRIAKMLYKLIQDQFENRQEFALKFIIHSLIDYSTNLSVLCLVYCNNLLVNRVMSIPRIEFLAEFRTMLLIWTLSEFAMDIIFFYLCLIIFTGLYFEGNSKLISKIYDLYLRKYGWFLVLGMAIIFILCFFVVYFIMNK